MAWYEIPDEQARALRRAALHRSTGDVRDTPEAIRLNRALVALDRRFPARPLDEIHELLDGQQWDSDTAGAIADVVRSTGRRIRPPRGLA